MKSKRTRMLFGFVILAALCLAVNTVQATPLPINGEHYNLNIIGVEKGKNPTAMGWVNENRHTIFRPAYGQDEHLYAAERVICGH